MGKLSRRLSRRYRHQPGTPPGGRSARKTGSIVIIIITVLILTVLLGMIKFFRYPKKKIVKEKMVAGEIHPPALQPGILDPSSYVMLENPPVLFTDSLKNNYPSVEGIRLRKYDSTGFTVFGVGNTVIPFPTPDLERGISFAIGKRFGCPGHTISLFLKNLRLYVAAEFRDIKEGQVMGAMEYDHWRLQNDNIGDVNQDDFGIEVKDKEGNIAFSICCGYGNVVYIAGYFIDQRSVMVIGNNYQQKKNQLGCIPQSESDWKDRAEDEAGLILSIFGDEKPY